MASASVPLSAIPDLVPAYPDWDPAYPDWPSPFDELSARINIPSGAVLVDWAPR